jgi:fengycin family lipopeptide synthetase B
MKLKGKIAIVTGGGRGLGRAIALAMAKEGASIVAMSRSKDEINGVVDKIKRAGGEGLPVSGDVSQEGHVSRMMDEIGKHFPSVDILVNNAAIVGPARFLADTDFDTWEKTIGINLHGVFLCCRAVVPIMAEQRSGKIINISSGLGQMPFPRFCAYAVSKAGVIQLTRSLSEELADYNIQVNAIDPGVMDTSMQQEIRNLGPSALGENLHRHFYEYKEKGVLRNPAKVSPLAVFLASSDANHLSGHNGTLDYYARLGWRP